MGIAAQPNLVVEGVVVTPDGFEVQFDRLEATHGLEVVRLKSRDRNVTWFHRPHREGHELPAPVWVDGSDDLCVGARGDVRGQQFQTSRLGGGAYGAQSVVPARGLVEPSWLITSTLTILVDHGDPAVARAAPVDPVSHDRLPVKRDGR